MIRSLTLAAFITLASAAGAQDTSRGTADAVAELEAAAAALAEARKGSDRIAALTQTIKAYEKGLSSMRVELRRAALRDREIRAEFDREADRLSRLLGALSSMGTSPETLVLLHPSGPVDTARAGMILADVTPGIDAQVDDLRARLEELAQLRALQDNAFATLQAGLDGVQTARAELAQAISDRTDLPPPITTDDAAMQALINSAETLGAFASSLALSEPDVADSTFAGARGTLPRPAEGVVIAGFNESDAAGVRRPGLLMATRPGAIVTAPWPATIRFRGPLLDYGEVTIVEPEAGYLLILGGLQKTFGETGEVVPQGAPLGLMGGAQPSAQEILIETSDGGGQDRTETLYIELRQGQTPQDPAPWFDLG